MKKEIDRQTIRKISVNFPGDLWKQLKRDALENDMTVTEILVNLSRDYLAQKAKRKSNR